MYNTSTRVVVDDIANILSKVNVRIAMVIEN